MSNQIKIEWEELTEKQTLILSAIGSGKTMTSAASICYNVYVVTTAYRLANMKRIPRKLKKKYKKNKDIWRQYKELKDNYSWNVTFNLPKCLKQNDLKTFDEDDFIIEEDNTIDYLNKWKELTEEVKQ